MRSAFCTWTTLPNPHYCSSGRFEVPALVQGNPCFSLDRAAWQPKLSGVSRNPGLVLTLWSVLILSACSAAAQPFHHKAHGSYPGRRAAERVEAASVLIVDASSGRVVAAKNASPVSYTHLTLPTKA